MESVVPHEVNPRIEINAKTLLNKSHRKTHEHLELRRPFVKSERRSLLTVITSLTNIRIQ